MRHVFSGSALTGGQFAAALAGMAFAFNGCPLQFHHVPSHVATYAWMPLGDLECGTGLARGGRMVVWAVLPGAMQMLAAAGNNPAHWLILSGLCLKPAAFNRSRRMRLPGVLLMGALWRAGAPQILPFDWMAHAQRSVE